MFGQQAIEVRTADIIGVALDDDLYIGIPPQNGGRFIKEFPAVFAQRRASMVEGHPPGQGPGQRRKLGQVLTTDLIAQAADLLPQVQNLIGGARELLPQVART